MKKSDFYYELPPELIAQQPLERRDASRLLYLPSTANTADKIQQHQDAPDASAADHEIAQIAKEYVFSELPSLLKPGDCLVINDTKVIPARLIGRKKETGAASEILLLKRLDLHRWECLARPGKRLREGACVEFIPGRLEAEIIECLDEGRRIVEFHFDEVWENLLDEAGQMPLPPYIHEKLKDKNRYQTVYAREEGSAAAPTAGLHFTPELMQRIEAAGIEIIRLTLHVGLGTFRPVKEDEIENHPMHSEYYELSSEAADRINATHAHGGRVIAVGTTSCRVLETLANDDGLVRPNTGNTDIFIYPPYRFKCVDALITNFHLPESTLVMLVSALAGRERILAAYRLAVRNKFRFFSFGDAMFIENQFKS